jgi:hypothetical protein
MPEPTPTTELAPAHRAANAVRSATAALELLGPSFDPELVAMTAVSATFRHLDDEEGARVLTWLRDRYHRWDSV